MRTVLCFGDSNTWGFDPETQQRFPRDVRWPGRLQGMLGEAWHVVEEGLNGRTTTLDSPISPGKNGLDYLVPCLESHAPLDAVVLYLGTNDLADRYAMTATDIARAAARLAAVVARSEAGANGGAPVPILVCPPPLGDTTWAEDWAGAPAKSAVLADRRDPPRRERPRRRGGARPPDAGAALHVGLEMASVTASAQLASSGPTSKISRYQRDPNTRSRAIPARGAVSSPRSTARSSTAASAARRRARKRSRVCSAKAGSAAAWAASVRRSRRVGRSSAAAVDRKNRPRSPASEPVSGTGIASSPRWARASRSTSPFERHQR